MTTALLLAAGDQPNAADWWSVGVNGLIALLTLAAVVIALVVLLHDRKVRNEELERRNDEDAERAEQARWDQAQHITAWLEWARPVYAFRAHIYNGSDRPIYDLEILNVDGDEVIRGWRRQVGLLPPGITVSGTMAMPSGWRTVDSRPLPVVFRDARGQWWEHTMDGVLIPHDDRPYGRDPMWSPKDDSEMPALSWRSGTPAPFSKPPSDPFPSS